MKRSIIIGALAAAVLAVPSVAAADPGGQGQNCENGAQNQNFCGDEITVEPATPEQCPTGGLVLLVNDEPVGVLCNGATGPAGPAGADGADGADGQNGTNGADGATGATGATGAAGADGAAGATGATGAAGTNGTDGVRGSDGKSVTVANCVSRRVIKPHLPGRFNPSRNVTVYVGSKKTTMRPSKTGRVTVNLTGKRCGVYAVVVRQKGVRAFQRIYTAGPNGGLGAYNVPPAKA